MKNTFAHLQLLVAKIDRRYIQFAYFAFILAGLVLTKAPSDGGGGPF
ncbi:MAG: hypothetical protein HXY35_00440 [Chloroflexi bacterium]|nr:hypothetical protein [Chloroflexota bacterium]